MNALRRIDYKLEPMNIVLIRTDWYKKWGTLEYFTSHPGMSAEAVRYILNQCVKTIGIDTFGFDRSFKSMGEDYKRTENKNQLWPRITG